MLSPLHRDGGGAMGKGWPSNRFASSEFIPSVHAPARLKGERHQAVQVSFYRACQGLRRTRFCGRVISKSRLECPVKWLGALVLVLFVSQQCNGHYRTRMEYESPEVAVGNPSLQSLPHAHTDASDYQCCAHRAHT